MGIGDSPKPDQSAPPGTLDVKLPPDSPTTFSAMGISQSAGENAGAVDARKVRPKRPFIVTAGIVGATLLSVMAITLLCYTWYTTEEYTTVIFVWAPPQWQGATVHVTGAGLAAPLSDQLSAANGQTVRFHVPEGHYQVRVVRDGKVLGQNVTSTPLTRNLIWWPFRTPVTSTQPSGK